MLPDFKPDIIKLGVDQMTRLILACEENHSRMAELMTQVWLNEWFMQWTLITEKGEVRRGALQKDTSSSKTTENHNWQKWL
jgi:hypothetical protein